MTTDRTTRKNTSIRRTAALVALASAALLTPVVTAAPALAWPGSATVTVTGKSGCWEQGPQQATVYGELNTQGHTSVQYGMPARYSITFTNVPSGGGWAWFTIHCSVGGDHNAWVRVYRPLWGSTLNVNL